MFVTAHAINRLTARIGDYRGTRIVLLCEALSGQPGTVAYIMGAVPGKVKAPAITDKWWLDSNGELVIAVAVDGSVETVFFRRASQDISAAFFGAHAVVDMRGA
jgi:hypothetical protein